MASSTFLAQDKVCKMTLGMAGNLFRLDLIPITRSKLLKQMGIGRSIRNDCLRHLPIFLGLFPTGLKQERDAKFTVGA